jgi:hypothetical protein
MTRLPPLHPRQQIPSPLSHHRRIRLIRRSIINLSIRNNTELNRRITLPIRTLCWPSSVIAPALRHIDFPRRDILAVDGALEDRQSSEGLVEGNFVARFVDTDEGEFRGLFHLPVGDAVGGEKIDEAGFGGEVVVVDFFGDSLASEPVAIVIGLEATLDS